MIIDDFEENSVGDAGFLAIYTFEKGPKALFVYYHSSQLFHTLRIRRLGDPELQIAAFGVFFV